MWSLYIDYVGRQLDVAMQCLEQISQNCICATRYGKIKDTIFRTIEKGSPGV